ncbi:LytTR family DNA-binding domain-containing protein [uncultured Thomasclavelia sp.]|uniref:LytR/AlgR family response regulator transcription factor n=1 Tax=uncultured Thomasclavelia sp. TaxID=3025759 RepID=UPI0025F14800|nr:LytTR family DNA-binding domain-containing protein [uncultured Thomasclavelia sp.]
MISIGLKTSNDFDYQKKLAAFFNENNIEYMIESINDSVYDIYLIEINSLEDYRYLSKIDKSNSLVYIVGLKNYQLLDEALTRQVNLYLDKDNFLLDLSKKKTEILRQINTNFKIYHYQKGHLTVNLRIKQIIYVESQNHYLTIHALSGTLVERKTLSQFIKEIDCKQFIQIHKSYVVNSLYIKDIKKQELYLQFNITLPIGRKYANIIIDQ